MKLYIVHFRQTCGDEADDFVLKNICYALSDCEQIVQMECGQNTCYSGQKVDIISFTKESRMRDRPQICTVTILV